jgi:hypothetical protein
MTEADDLPSAFACAAQVGTAGNWSERPMEAMMEAVSDDLAGPGKCNEGFLRDDALLVIVVISDEPEGPGDPEGPPPDSSVGDPQSWHDAVVAAKNGIDENAVVLTLTDDQPPANMVTFTELFGDTGFAAPIWGDYGPIFEEAVGLIDVACDNFVPQ